MHKAIAVFLALAVLASPVSAGVMAYTDLGMFNGAVGGLNFLGSEDFESSTLAPNSATSLDDSLAPGAPNGPFPLGTNPDTGMTVQSNTLTQAGGTPVTPSPRGVGGLSTASAGFFGTPDDQISASFAGDSLDLIFAPPGAEPILGVGFTPLFFDLVTFGLLGDLTIRAYDSFNNLLLTTGIFGGDYINEDSFFGIVADGGDNIGRINIAANDFTIATAGVDDVFVYSAQPTGPPGVPAPATLALVLIGLLGLVARRQRT